MSVKRFLQVQSLDRPLRRDLFRILCVFCTMVQRLRKFKIGPFSCFITIVMLHLHVTSAVFVTVTVTDSVLISSNGNEKGNCNGNTHVS